MQEAVQSATAAMEVFKQAGNSEGDLYHRVPPGRADSIDGGVVECCGPIHPISRLASGRYVHVCMFGASPTALQHSPIKSHKRTDQTLPTLSLPRITKLKWIEVAKLHIWE